MGTVESISEEYVEKVSLDLSDLNTEQCRAFEKFMLALEVEYADHQDGRMYGYTREASVLAKLPGEIVIGMLNQPIEGGIGIRSAVDRAEILIAVAARYDIDHGEVLSEGELAALEEVRKLINHASSQLNMAHNVRVTNTNSRRNPSV